MVTKILPDDMINSFPVPRLKAIVGRPDYFSLSELRADIKDNAGSFDTTRGGGQNGHLGAVISATAYARVDANNPYVTPTNPGTFTPTAGATDAQIAIAQRQHKLDLIEWYEYASMQQALKKQIMAAIDRKYIAPLRTSPCSIIFF
jgi:hypothetical protein